MTDLTEPEWLASKDAYMLLYFLSGKVSARKLRLFACSIGRRLWGRLDQEAVRRAVEVAELVADGRDSPGKLGPVCQAAFKSVRGPRGVHARWVAANSAYPDAWHAAAAAACQAHMTGLRKVGVLAILREVVGNSFRPVTLDPAWRTPDAVALAAAAYDERLLPSGELDPLRLQVLADALEEAGCQNADILGHLRSPGPHCRGCFVLDRLLGRE